MALTVKELYDNLWKMIRDGHGGAEVLFDTDAQRYDTHLVPVDSALIYSPDDGPISKLVLSEDHPHRGH